MSLTSDIILDWIHDDGYSFSEAGWIRPQHHEFYFEVTAEKDGHRHIARTPGDGGCASWDADRVSVGGVAALLNVILDETKDLPF